MSAPATPITAPAMETSPAVPPPRPSQPPFLFAPPSPRPVPELHNGDHLTVDEFERRYAAMPPEIRAELIEGVVYMASPVRHTVHSRPQAALLGWLTLYWYNTPGVDAGDNATVRLDGRNQPQPDGLLFIRPDYGGRVRLSAEGCIEGAPELAAEVSASTVSIDLNAKMDAYRRNGVREYVVWRVEDGQVDWFALRDGRYERLAADAEGVVRSEVFPGLWLPPVAMAALDLPAVQRVARAGVESPEHAAFVESLARRKTQAT
jgi:hypothetical protein